MMDEQLVKLYYEEKVVVDDEVSQKLKIWHRVFKKK
jgi:hypothetical protein